MRGRDVGMTDDRLPHRPEQVRHEITDRGLGIDDRDVDVTERRPDPVGADEIDVDLGAGAAEVLQDGNGELHGEARRHLHTQRSLHRSAFVADVIERVFEAIERLYDRRQQMLPRLGQSERMRPPLEELHSREALERDDVARQGALRDQQRVGGRGEAAVLGDTFEGAQRIKRQPAAVDRFFVHRLLRAGGVSGQA